MVVPAVVLIALLRYDLYEPTSRWVVWSGAVGGAIVVAVGQSYCWPVASPLSLIYAWRPSMLLPP